MIDRLQSALLLLYLRIIRTSFCLFLKFGWCLGIRITTLGIAWWICSIISWNQWPQHVRSLNQNAQRRWCCRSNNCVWRLAHSTNQRSKHL